MILVGSIGFLDPPKETSGEAIRALNNKGVQVIVITGDNEIATRRVCREIGFDITGLVEGTEVDQLSDEALQQIVKTTNVFVRTASIQKSRILVTAQAALLLKGGGSGVAVKPPHHSPLFPRSLSSYEF